MGVPAVALAGLNRAVTPEGSPDAVRVTVPLKPPDSSRTMWVVAELGRRMVSDDGDGARAMLGTSTVRVTVVLAASEPETPLIVTVEIPGMALEDAVKTSELLAVAEAGVKATVTPAGSPLAVSATAPEKPFWPAMAMVVDAVEKRARVREAGVAARVKRIPGQRPG
jgi:antitoxin (DNA-binding transcriptional repressor) of toxin-antitoxin stability system